MTDLPDAIFGSKTREAVMQFQYDHGLDDDGIVGPLTWDALQDENTFSYHSLGGYDYYYVGDDSDGGECKTHHYCAYHTSNYVWRVLKNDNSGYDTVVLGGLGIGFGMFYV